MYVASMHVTILKEGHKCVYEVIGNTLTELCSVIETKGRSVRYLTSRRLLMLNAPP
jgi:hypothetical protein